MWLKRISLVWAAVLAVAVLGAQRAPAAPASSWTWDNLLEVAAGNQPFQAPTALAVGDLDGNGLADYVVADSATNTLHVLLLVDSPFPGVGTSLVYATGTDPSSVAVGDLNGDSIRDLVVADAGDGAVTVRLGVDNGPGATPRFEWPTPITYATGGSPQSHPLSLAIGDLDNDGDNDVAVANFGSSNPADDDQGSVTVLRNDCCGSFPLRTELGIDHPLSLAIGDLNGDPRKDLVVADTQAGAAGVSVLLQDAVGLLIDTYDQPVGAQPVAVGIADLNDDGIPDLITADEGANAVSLLLSEQGQPLVRRRDVATGGRPRSVAVADLNGDGVPDLATANGSGSVSVLPGVGNGTFLLPRQDLPNDSSPTALVPGSPAAIAAVDWLFADDGKPDLAVAGGGANPLGVLVNTTPPDTDGSVSVTPVDRSTGESPVTITFLGAVTSPGVTTLRSSDSGPPPPDRFELGNGLYYELHTTAAFNGDVEICFSFGNLLANPTVGHYVNGAWDFPAVTRRPTSSEVCVEVTSFSPFALLEPAQASDSDAPVVACGSADGAWHGANVSIPCTAHDDGSGLADQADATFSLSTSVPAGAEDANASTGSRRVCDRAGNCANAGPIGGNQIDRLAPLLTLPADRTVDATGPGGAAVSYSASATDGAHPSPSVSCTPASGATFAIGSTAVSCTATDHVSNTSSGTFHLTVLGAKEQLSRLIQKVVDASKLPQATKTQLISKLQALVATLDPTKPAQRQAVCAALKVFTAAVQLLSGHGIPPAQAAEWVADANRIRAVLGC
jgi:hypothetical protein